MVFKKTVMHAERVFIQKEESVDVKNNPDVQSQPCSFCCSMIKSHKLPGMRNRMAGSHAGAVKAQKNHDC